jgi:hypothetical protein
MGEDFERGRLSIPPPKEARRIDPLSLAFKNKDDERGFRAHFDEVERKNCRLAVYLSLVIVVVFATSDARLLPPEDLPTVRGLRAGFVAIILVIGWLLRRADSQQRDALMLFWMSFAAIMNAVITYGRPDDHFAFVAVDLVVIMTFHNLISGAFLIQVTGAVAFSAISIFVVASKDLGERGEATAIGMAYLLCHVVGAAVSRRNHFLRRKQHSALLFEQELRARLEATTREIKELRGIVPICASCKCVRDDGGFWHQVEAYVEARSDAQFSHGVCPNCAKLLENEIESNAPPK